MGALAFPIRIPRVIAKPTLTVDAIMATEPCDWWQGVRRVAAAFDDLGRPPTWLLATAAVLRNNALHSADHSVRLVCCRLDMEFTVGRAGRALKLNREWARYHTLALDTSGEVAVGHTTDAQLLDLAARIDAALAVT